MSDAELDRLEVLAAQATPPPWRVRTRGRRVVGPAGVAVADLAALPGPAGRQEQSARAREREANADLIAALRVAVPALVAEVRRLRAARAKEGSP